MSVLLTTFEESRTDLVKYAARLGSHDPEGAVQDAIVHALEKRYDTKYDSKGKLSPVAYARLLVYWQVRSAQRKDSQHGHVVVNGYDTTEVYTGDQLPNDALDYVSSDAAESEEGTDPEREEIVIDVRKAVASLPEEERWVAEAILLDGLTIDEYADLMGYSRSRVHRTLTKTRDTLRHLLRHYDTAGRTA